MWTILYSQSDSKAPRTHHDTSKRCDILLLCVLIPLYMFPHTTVSSYRHNAIATHTYTKIYIPRPLQYIEAHYTQGSFFFNFLFLAAITPAPRPGSIGTASWRQAFWPRYAGCASPKSVQPCGAARWAAPCAPPIHILYTRYCHSTYVHMKWNICTHTHTCGATVELHYALHLHV